MKDKNDSPVVLWVNKIQKEKIKQKAKKENRTVSNFCKWKLDLFD